MTHTMSLCCGLALGASLAAVPHARAAASAATAKHATPLACDRLALSPKERERHFGELGPGLHALRKSTRELRDGYEFEFAPDPATFRLLSEWMIEEHSCCPFFDLSLRLDREGGPLWLRMTGRKGVKEFIAAEFPPEWFR